MDPAPISLAIGFALRIFLLAFDRHSQLRPAFLGIWEGIALYRGLSTISEPQLTTYLACGLRLMFDFLFTENPLTMVVILFSLVLALLLADALGSHHDHDIQLSHRSDVQRSRARNTQAYEAPDSLNRRARLVIPPTNYPTEERHAATPSPVVQQSFAAHSSENADQISSVIFNVQHHSPSAEPVHMVDAQIPNPNPITPPCTPPERRSSGYVTRDRDLGSQSESHEDELQTPLLGNPQTFHENFDTVATGQASVIEDTNQRDEDELQTPLALNLRDLPLITAEPGQLEDEVGTLLLESIPFLDDSASLIEDGIDVPGDNGSELSLGTGTELSIISASDAQIITAKAELLRRQAWDEQKKKPQLERELNQAVSEGKIKDAFLLRLEIDAVEERAKQIHGRAARRHFRGKQLPPV
ncbi:hypothetical protein DFH09DRAFT_236768 [Mycena vulgaris]|nr:hypothetical protein DFH09DRAFT_236768 [Mycena vulgaris]